MTTTIAVDEIPGPRGLPLLGNALDIDEIVPPGTDVGAPDQSAFVPPALQHPSLRRRPEGERTAA